LFTCPICNGDAYKKLFDIDSTVKDIPKGLTRRSHEKVTICYCNTCKLKFNAKVISNYDYQSLYTQNSIYANSDTYQDDKMSYPKYSKDTVKLLMDVCEEGQSVLEIGPFKGDLMLELKQNNYSVIGVELDPKAAEIARGRGLSIISGDIHDRFFDDQKYDAIVGVGVLEHIEYPDRWVERISQILTDEGVLILQYPNPKSLNAMVSRYSIHNWDMYLEPGHIYFYSQENIDRLLEKFSLSIDQFHTATILERGKVPFLPTRNSIIEKLMMYLCRSKTIYLIYWKLLSLLDLFKGGDTSIVIARKKNKETNRLKAQN
jgi:SAM-dependent methyltransferase